jgi:hypothetical protein
MAVQIKEESASMCSRVSSTFLGVGLLGLTLSMSSVRAGTVLVFGQNGTSNQFTATNNGSMGNAGGTVLSAVDIGVTITGIDNSVPLPGSFPEAFFNLSATSNSNAANDGAGHITQDFSGSFSITSLAGGGGTNYLSGTFLDAVFGNGTGLVMTSSGPLGVPTFTSDVIATLGQTRAISLSFSNVTPSVFVTGDLTLGAFTSGVSGTYSAIPEPTSFVLLSLGLAGCFALGYRSTRPAVS